VTHVRTQIRDSVVTTLTGIAALKGNKVRNAPVYPTAKDQLPTAAVYLEGEEPELTTGGAQRRIVRPAELVIELLARGSDDELDAELNALLEGAEIALAADPTFGGLVKESFIDGVEIERERGSNPHGKITATYMIEYHTQDSAPGAALA